MQFRLGLLVLCALLSGLRASLRAGESPLPPADYVPDPDIEDLLQLTLDSDRNTAERAVAKLASLGLAAERSLNWHLQRELTPAGRLRWAELLARCGRGKTGYRVTLELQPEGSGTVTLWSDRTLLAECGMKYDSMMGKPPSTYSEEALRFNPYSKVELFNHLREGVTFQEARVDARGASVEALGVLMFNSFDVLSAFAESFDSRCWHMLGGLTLNDSHYIRTLRFKKPYETDPRRFQDYLLLFHDVKWEFALDFKGKIRSHNATRVEGNKLIWVFDCQQMLTGNATLEASFDARNLPPRPAPRQDDAQVLPPVAQANQPVAVANQEEIHARVSKKSVNEPPTAKDLKERKQLIELDGRGSYPKSPDLKFQWVQTAGKDLNLPSEKFAKPYVCLTVYEAGEYGFELTVNSNGVASKPAEVRVIVEEEEAAKPVVAAVPPAVQPPHRDEPAAKRATGSDIAARANAGNTGSNIADSGTPVKVTEPPVAVRAAEGSTGSNIAASGTPKESRSPSDLKADFARAQDLHARGRNLEKSFQWETAKEVLAQALKLNPDDADCQFDLAVAMMELSEKPNGYDKIGTQEALFKFNEVLRSGDNAHAMMNIGHCYARLNRMNEANGNYRAGRSVGKDAVSWEPIWQLGNKLLKDNDYERARDLFLSAEKTAAVAEVKDYRLLRDAAIALHGVKQDDEALKRLDTLLGLGYWPDPKLMEEVKRSAAVGAKTAAAEPRKTEATAKPTIKIHESANAEPPPRVAVKPPEQAPAFVDPPVNVIDTANQTATNKPQSAVSAPKVEPRHAAETPLSEPWPRVEPAKPPAVSVAVAEPKPASANPPVVKPAPKVETRRVPVTPLPEPAPKVDLPKPPSVSVAVADSALSPQHSTLSPQSEVLNPKPPVVEPAPKAETRRATVKPAPEAALPVVEPAKPPAVSVAIAEPKPATAKPPIVESTPKAETRRIPVAPPPEPAPRIEPAKPPAVSAAVADAVRSPQHSTLGTEPSALSPKSPVTEPAPKVEDHRAAVKPPPEAALPVVEPAKPPAVSVAVAEPKPAPAKPPVKEPTPKVETHRAVATPLPEPAPKVEPAKPPAASVAVVEPKPAPAKPPAPTPASKKAVPEPKRPLPPVPATFDEALAAGKRAYQKGIQFQAKRTDDTKRNASESFDEAEAMLRGAWEMRRGDPAVIAGFQDLAEEIGAIALVKNQSLVAKPKGLVVLDAEASIVPKNKRLYCVWEQTEGEDLGKRPEEMAVKKVALRINKPGIYKFELAVSDGNRGGNPITVTVEVRE